MVREFKRFMIFYGLTYSEFQIVKGDFMAQAPQEQVKRAALVIFNSTLTLTFVVLSFL